MDAGRPTIIPLTDLAKTHLAAGRGRFRGTSSPNGGIESRPGRPCPQVPACHDRKCGGGGTRTARIGGEALPARSPHCPGTPRAIPVRHRRAWLRFARMARSGSSWARRTRIRWQRTDPRKPRPSRGDGLRRLTDRGPSGARSHRHGSADNEIEGGLVT